MMRGRWGALLLLALPVAAVLALYSLRSAGHNHGQHDEWIRSLKRPDGGGSCCNLQDCRVTAARITPRGWEARNQFGMWVDVPADKIIRNRGNPTGAPVLCWLPGPGVMCFIEPIGV